ncbi:hypothetical protein POL68_06045 [Stigmatella sp. ncwal1]|uniref:Uncharacterized protein n=1 Tax=Stigmatella ashevillensis TaxID=2995309 RepID=A0ABT5D2X9_9BACT|nr:hypothetical protein [Stigmatella ashevillena]MDC0708026.1 hypothetical protein [Stigmatella ashevillena]
MNRFRAVTSLTVLATIALWVAPLGAAVAAEPGAKPASTQEAAPSAPASTPSPLTFHLQVRVNTLAQGRHDAFLDDYRFESILAVPGVSGELTPWFSYVFNAVGSAENFESAQVRLLDTVGMFKVSDPLQIWVGRFVVPFDRFNLSGPFRNLIWDYPGIYGGERRIGGENGPFGRDTGISVWGSLSQGLFKYQLMAHQLENPDAGPRLTGRMSVSLLDREPGYFVSSSYLGEKNVLALGVAVQYQHDGRTWTPGTPVGVPPPPVGTPVSPTVDNLLAVTADLFAEKTFGSMGTATLDLAYYHYDEYRPYRRAHAVTVAYIPPLKLGDGRTQFGLRWEEAFASRFQPQLSNVRGVDVSVSHFFSGYNLRLGLDYAHQWLGSGGASNTVSVGFQYSPPLKQPH